jgi:hypothetical protein
MSAATHYTILGLTSTAAPEVIRAAYKALALIYHPDKTLHLPPGDRVSYAAFFRDVQASWDVLGSPALKAAYDAELERHNNNVDAQRSTSQNTSAHAGPNAATPQRKHSVKLTTPGEKAAARAQARQSLDYLRAKRAALVDVDAQLDVAELKAMVETWKELAEENKADPATHAHCAIRVYEYEQKIADREQQHTEWLLKMSTSKYNQSIPARHGPCSPDAPKKPMASSSTACTRSSDTTRTRSTDPTSSDTSPAPVSRGTARAKERERANAERAAEAAARTESRTHEKARREALKQAQTEAKTAAVRAEKEKQKLKVELQAQKDAERIAKARAKAGVAPPGTVGGVVVAEVCPSDATSGTSSVSQAALSKAALGNNKICSKCGTAHANFRDWMKCNKPAAPVHAQ